jgi:hypothetical protein
MIRRAPSSIPVRQTDANELEAFLAAKRAEANQAEAAAKDAVMAEEASSQGKGKGKQKAGSNTGKGKGKGRANAVAAADDSLVQGEAQARAQRDGLTRDQRMGV